MEDEEKKEEEKKEEKNELSDVIRQAKELINEQRKTIEEQKTKIDELSKNNIEKQEESKEVESVTDMLTNFKKDITEMLQGYNRNNPTNNNNDTSFEDAQMDMLKRRF